MPTGDAQVVAAVYDGDEDFDDFDVASSSDVANTPTATATDQSSDAANSGQDSDKTGQVDNDLPGDVSADSAGTSGDKTSDKPADKAASPDKKAADAFTAAALAEAQSYGISEAEARQFGSPENLERAMATLDRRMSELGRAELKKQAGDTGTEQTDATSDASASGSQSQAPEKKQPEAAPAKQPTGAAARPALKKFEIKLPTEGADSFDPDTVKFLNELNDHHFGIETAQQERITKLEALVNQLASSNEQLTGFYQAEASARYEAAMDSFFSTLEPELAAVYGNEAISALPDGSDKAKARLQLEGEMSALQAADIAIGRKSSTIPQLAQRAMRSLNGDKIETIARRKLNAQVAQTRGSAIDRPTGRQTKAGTREVNAKNFVKQYLQDHGAFEDEEAELLEI